MLWRQVSLGQAMRPGCGRPRLASAAARAACATEGRWRSGGAVCGEEGIMVVARCGMSDVTTVGRSSCWRLAVAWAMSA